MTTTTQPTACKTLTINEMVTSKGPSCYMGYTFVLTLTWTNGIIRDGALMASYKSTMKSGKVVEIRRSEFGWMINQSGSRTTRWIKNATETF